MVAAAGGSDREVLIRIRTVADQGNVAALRGVSEAIKKANGEAVKSHQTASKAAEKAAKDQTREWEKANRAMQREDVRTFQARMKAIKEREKEELRAAKAIQDAAKAQAGQQAKSAQAAQTALAKVREANQRTVESFKQSLEGAMALGRGIATLGIVGEKDTEKMLRALIKVQAAFDIMRGTVTIVQALARGYQAYRTAVLAAAAAQATLAAAQAAGGGGAAVGAGAGVLGKLGLGGGAVVGGGGALAGAGIAAAASVGLAGTVAWQTGFGFRQAEPDSISDKIGYEEVGAAGHYARLPGWAKAGLKQIPGVGGLAAGAEALGLDKVGADMLSRQEKSKRVAERAASNQTRRARREGLAESQGILTNTMLGIERSTAMTASDMGYYEKPTQRAAANLRTVQGFAGAAESRYTASQAKSGTRAEEMSAAQDLLGVYQQIRDATMQEAAVRKAAAQESFEKAKSELAILRQKVDLAVAERTAAEQAKTGTFASIGMMGAEQRAQYFVAAQRVQEGNASEDDLRLVAGGPSSRLAYQAQQMAADRGRQIAAQSGLGADLVADQDATIARTRGAEAAARRQRVTVDTAASGQITYTIASENKLEIDVKTDERKMTEALKTVIMEHDRKMAALFKRIADEEYDRRELDRLHQAATVAKG